MTKLWHPNLKCRHLKIVDKNSEMNNQVSTPELEVSILSDRGQNLGKTKTQLFWSDFQACFGSFNLEI